jgi:SAM-dependent methyltransferase
MSSQPLPLLSEIIPDKNDEDSHEGINRYSLSSKIDEASLLKICYKYCHISSQHEVLDFGCGTGRILENLRMVCKASGVDICQLYVDICRESGVGVDYVDLRHDEFNPNGKIEVDDFRLPYRNGQFDRIVAFYVFNHYVGTSFRRVFRECVSKLRRSGLMVMSCLIIPEQMMQSLLQEPNPSMYNVDNHWWISDPMRPNLRVAASEIAIRRIVMENKCQIVEPIRFGNWSEVDVKNIQHDMILIRKL